jgi:GMP synthase-like glutamine amidotransferase
VSVRCLVVENDPTAGLGNFAEWLTDGGLALEVTRPHAGERLPEDLAGWGALVVLGGHQPAYPAPDGTPSSPWFPTLESLLRHAVREQVPTLGICLGAQLLARAHNGTVAPAARPEVGPALVAKRDAAESDPLFAPLPMLPDVLQWHGDEITELPLGAVLLATSTACPVQAFRLGSAAWGVQFHPEVDLPTLAGWVNAADDSLPEQASVDRALVLSQAEQLQDDLFEVWHPFAIRFAALAAGSLTPPPSVQPGRQLPLLDS